MPFKKSEFLGTWGKAFQIFKAIVDAILARGGDDEDVARLEQMAGQIADLAIGGRPVAEIPDVKSQPKPVVPAFPAEGEEFDLELDGDVPENQPLEMVRRDRCERPEKWRFTGREVEGKQVRRFKLVAVGYCRNLDEVRGKLAVHGEILEGQWRAAYCGPQVPGGCSRPVGIADPSWVDLREHVYFPYVPPRGFPAFYRVDHVFDIFWLWLVEVRK